MARPVGGSDDAKKEIKNNKIPKFFGNKCSPSFINYNESITKYFTGVGKSEKTKHD